MKGALIAASLIALILCVVPSAHAQGPKGKIEISDPYGNATEEEYPIEGTIPCGSTETIWESISGPCDVAVEYWSNGKCTPELLGPNDKPVAGKLVPAGENKEGPKKYSHIFYDVSSIKMRCMEHDEKSNGCSYSIIVAVGHGKGIFSQHSSHEGYACSGDQHKLQGTKGCWVTIKSTSGPDGCKPVILVAGTTGTPVTGKAVTVFGGGGEQVSVKCEMGKDEKGCSFNFQTVVVK